MYIKYPNFNKEHMIYFCMMIPKMIRYNSVQTTWGIRLSSNHHATNSLIA